MSLHNIYIYYIYGIILYTWIINVHVFFKMFRNHCGFQWSQHRRCWSKTGRFSGLFGTCTDVFLDDCWMKQDMRGSEGFWGIFFGICFGILIGICFGRQLSTAAGDGTFTEARKPAGRPWRVDHWARFAVMTWSTCELFKSTVPSGILT